MSIRSGCVFTAARAWRSPPESSACWRLAAAAGAAALFVATLWSTRYVSLGSIAAAVVLPALAWATGAPSAVLWAAGATAALILFRHSGNLRRLRAGTEPG